MATIAPKKKARVFQFKKTTKNATLSCTDSLVGSINPYRLAVQKLQRKCGIWEKFFNSDVELSNRSAQWDKLDNIEGKLTRKYAWAIPDDRSLHILKNFSPLIEIGSGRGYWAALLRNLNVDILAVEKYVPASAKCWTKIASGGPETLKSVEANGRNLFLCYPDESESIAIQCLDNFKGEYVVHVGELLYTNGTLFGEPQAPFGRTSSAEFQMILSQSFHCLLTYELSLTLPYSRDCVSVWKRTHFITGRIADNANAHDDSNNDNSDSDKSNDNAAVAVHRKIKSKTRESDEGEDMPEEYLQLSEDQRARELDLDDQYADCGNKYASITEEERMPVTRAAPCLEHLLRCALPVPVAVSD